MEKFELRNEFIKNWKEKNPTEPQEEYKLQGDINYCEFLEEKLCKLIDYHHGLYAIDFNPIRLLYRFIESQSDACQLKAEDAEQLQVDWEAWINNENLGKSPFYTILFDKNEKLLIDRISEMCIESLDPETFQKWEDVKEVLINTRKYFKNGA